MRKVIIPGLVLSLFVAAVGGVAAYNNNYGGHSRMPDILANVAMMEVKTESTALSGGNYVANVAEVGGNVNTYNKTTIDTGDAEALANSTVQVNTPGECACEADVVKNMAWLDLKTSADAISGANQVENVTLASSQPEENSYRRHHNHHNNTPDPNTVTNETYINTGDAKATTNSLAIVNSSYSLIP